MARIGDAQLAALVTVVHQPPAAAERVDLLLGDVNVLAGAGAAVRPAVGPLGAVARKGDARQGSGAVAEGLATGLANFWRRGAGERDGNGALDGGKENEGGDGGWGPHDGLRILTDGCEGAS